MSRLFTCAICQREIAKTYFDRGRRVPVSPVCQRCELQYGHRPPQVGSFMDRRKCAQISALAEALHSEAIMQQWRSHHGRA